MRIARVLPLLLTLAFIWALNHSFGTLPAIGRLIDPVNGAMAAAEPYNEDWNRNLRLKDLNGPVSIWLDTSLIAHIRAGNDHDLYYAQGYIHATFRLWQMDLQTRAAGGRVSEVAGPKAIGFDRGMRREGMVWGAQHSLAAMEAEPRTKAMLDAYRDGINAYVHSLNYRRLPVEYKLMGFYPEDWTNLRTALLMKYMARDLTGKTDDIAYTQLRDELGQEQFDFLFPERIKGSRPVIPEGTKFEKPSLKAPPVPGGDVWAHFGDSGNNAAASGSGIRSDGSGRPSLRGGKASLNDGMASRSAGRPSDCDGMASRSVATASLRLAMASHSVATVSRSVAMASDGAETPGEESGIGSNNWAIAGSHTASGKTILCNDPHLALNLPSLWYEMQLTAPGINAYGASLPGAPGIVIGFNEKISWGFTNNYRDVKDFYEITTVPPAPYNHLPSEEAGEWTPTRYFFNGQLRRFGRSIEVIKVKGGTDVIDTVLYTIHGPVTYDPSFPDEAKSGKLLACTWMGHRGSNELLATYLLNRAGDYAAFTNAISHFECPAQNIAYADVSGNIAMWGQGRFINKWKGQGKYVMRGTDSSTLWGDAIPWQENPHVLNPPQGYVASANQQVTDSSYPYWYNGSFVEWRSWEINKLLEGIVNGKTIVEILSPNQPEPDRKYPLLDSLRYDCGDFNSKFQFLFMDKMQNNVGSELMWRTLPFAKYEHGYMPNATNCIPHEMSLGAESQRATSFQIEWSILYNEIWKKTFSGIGKYPSSERTLEIMLSDSTSKYYDDPNTTKVETLRDIFFRAEGETLDSLDKLKRAQSLEWYRVKNTTLTHLAKIPAFSYDHLKIGGWSNTINACTGDHGPSWRMIVEMDETPKAYAIYPGGQSGNPGSRHYSDFIDQWVEGKYHAIQFITAAVTKNPFTYTWTLTP